MNNQITVTRGLMVGRFQPFHNGHLHLAKQILKECDELIIAIGSAQFNYIYKDPFTAGERVLMVHAALSSEPEIDLTRCYIIPIVNDENNARWFGHLKSMVPIFHVLYSGNDFVAGLASREVKIKKPSFLKKDEYNGTNIRKQIATMQQQNWKSLLPNAVCTIIEEIGGVKRIEILAGSDSYPQQW
ncbi:MAG: nicotinamide-nucleotide adenylyltransferase [Nitrososphaeraceae archaeon]